MIEIKHLSKRFPSADGEFTALDDINLTIDDGDIFGIIGMSGAGKSTLIRCINMLETPSEGSIVIDGSDMTTLPPKALRQKRRDISMIFQHFQLLMQRNCLKNICFPMEIAGVKAADAKKRALELLEIVDMTDKANAYPAQLSGGQKQRIAIARALASNPKLLLSDESTSALDPTTTQSILKLIKEINRKMGITCIMITHEMAVVKEICSHVAILEHGHIVETGTVEDIFANPQTEIGKKLVSPLVTRAPEQLNIDHWIRITFNELAAYQPLISSLAIDCGVRVNILDANIKNVEGKTSGSMILGMPKEKAEQKRIIDYLTHRPDVSVEVVNHE